MHNNLLLLSEDGILVEQLRLMLSNVASVLIPSSILIVLLAWGLTLTRQRLSCGGYLC